MYETRKKSRFTWFLTLLDVKSFWARRYRNQFCPLEYEKVCAALFRKNSFLQKNSLQYENLSVKLL